MSRVAKAKAKAKTKTTTTTTTTTTRSVARDCVSGRGLNDWESTVRLCFFPPHALLKPSPLSRSRHEAPKLPHDPTPSTLPVPLVVSANALAHWGRLPSVVASSRFFGHSTPSILSTLLFFRAPLPLYLSSSLTFPAYYHYYTLPPFNYYLPPRKNALYPRG